MPTLANAKHERFAQELAAGKTADEAYVSAGYRANRGNATTLKANQSVSKRVAELQSRAAEGLIITQQWLIERAEEARRGAMNAGQHAAAVAAIKEIGILTGDRVEKRENRNTTIGELSDAELADIARGCGEGAFAKARGSSLPN